MLDRKYFRKNTLDLAKDLLGNILVRKIDGQIIRAKIVETEAYLGVNDRACHTFLGKKTDRNKIMYMDAGTLYVYQTYGIHFLLNISSVKEGVPEAILLRAIEPLENFDLISKNRFGKNYQDLSIYQRKNLSNGPAKLTKALKIDKNFNGKDIFSKDFYMEEGKKDFEIIKAKRIGIDYAKEAKDYLYRFYIKDNPYVSKLES